MFDTNTVTVIAAFLTFVTTIVGSLIAWNKSNNDERAGIRTDIFKMNEKLQEEMAKLRARIDAVEAENDMHARTVRELETRIAKIHAALYTIHNIDLNAVLAEYDEHIKKKVAGA